MSGKSHAKVAEVDARSVGGGESSARARWLVGAAFGGVIGAAGLAFASQTGCQLQGVCAPSSAWFPGPPPAPSVLPLPNPSTASLPNSGISDPDTWQSSGMDDPWIFFPGGRTYTIFPFVGSAPGAESDRFFGPDWDFELFVATDSKPASEGNFTIAGGNIAEIFLVTDPAKDAYLAQYNQAMTPDGGPFPAPPVFNVVNATCADYYLRILVHRHPGGTGGDASTPDPDASVPPIDAAPDTTPDPLDGGAGG